MAPAELWHGKIERLAWGGKGIARSEDGRLLLLSAPLALFPGEEVDAEVHWKARHGEGRVLRWTRRDPRRVPAGCPVAEACGGCDLWEAGDAAAELKRAMAEDLLHRQLPAMEGWHYLAAPPSARRHRIQLHWDGEQLGYFRRGSHDIIPTQACPAAAAAVSSAIPRLAEALRGRALPTRTQRWELATGTPEGAVMAVDEGGRAWSLEPGGWHRSDAPVEESFPGFTLRHAPGGFFQVCPPWAEAAFRSVLEGWDLRGGTLFDLYGGVGFFSALLGRRFARAVLVESGAAAAAWAARNLAELGLAAECHASATAQWLPEGLGREGDAILLDPPRSGLEPEVAARLHSAKASTLVLVGCDGAAFCRDAKALAPAWVLQDLVALDLFPQTHHVEFVGLFRKG